MPIWTTPSLTICCEAVYTDNPKVDKNAILEVHDKLFPDAKNTLDVCLDIFHAKNRVVRELQHNHPDYKAAVSDLGKIFGLIISRGYDFKENLACALLNFGESFSVPTTRFSKNDKILYIGMHNCDCYFIKKLISHYVQIGKIFSDKTIKQGLQQSGKDQPNDILPIMNAKALHQLKLLATDPDLESLWQIGFHTSEVTQGTSHNEALHSLLRSLKPSKSTKMSYEMLNMLIGIITMHHNQM